MKLMLRSIREENGLLQKHIAGVLGVTQQTYARYEAGLARPSFESMALLAAFFHTSVDYLLGLTDEKKPYKRI